jgi:hypothetical protein
MSYTQQAILRDKNGDPIPQMWDVTQNKFVPYTNNDIKLLQNELVLVKSELETIKANQLSGDQKVQLSGTLTELEQAIVLLDAISGKDFATQTTLAAVLAKLADLESELATIKANQLSGDQKVQLSGAIFGAGISDRPPANSVPVGTTFVITNAELDAWISNGTDWVVI